MTPEQAVESAESTEQHDAAEVDAAEVSDEFEDDEGSSGGVWLSIGLFVVFVVGVSGCFAFQVF